MLVLHPRSCCDVCLEPYSQHSIARSPHALPCGHVFCKQCLDSIRPPNCPLCRGHFMPDRLKKLFVDEPRDADDRLLAEENELLRTLMLFWDGSDSDLVNWTRQVDSWLEGRAGTHAALNKARVALAEYQRLKNRKERDKLTIKALKERDRVHVAEKDNTQAVEQSLLTQISQLEAKLSESEKVRQTLQTQVARYKLKNPLPQPPEVPVPLEQLSTAAATTHTSSLYTVPEAGPSSSRRQSHNNGSVVPPDPRFLTPFYVPVPSSQPPSQPHPPENERDRKGKRRVREGYGRHSAASSYIDAHSFLAPSSYPNGVLSDDERGVIVPGAVTQRRVIPPKEVTLSNTPFPPPSNEGEDYSSSREGTSSYDPAASLNPYSLAALYIGEYVNGYGEGYNAATNLNSQSPQAVGSSHVYNASGEGQTPRDAWRHDSIERAALVSRNPNEPHHLPVEREPRQLGHSMDQENESGEERLVYNVHRLGDRSSITSIHADVANSGTDHVENGYIMNSSHPSTNTNNVNGTSHSRPHRSQRRRTSGFVPGHETDVESARRARDDPIAHPIALPFQRPSSVSVSSWIHPPVATTATTIATASNVNITRTRAAQSTASGLNELGLSTFGPDSMYPNPPGGTPRSTLSSLGLHSFPLREDDEIVMERLPSANSGSSGSAGRTAQETTPRQRSERHVSFDRRPAFIGGGVGTTAVGLGQATIATSAISAIVTTASSTNANLNESTSTSRSAQRRSGRHTTSIDHIVHGPRNTTTSARSSSAALVPTSAVPAPPAVTILGSPSAMEDAMHLAVAEMPRPLPRTPPRFRNALGLQLELSERTGGDTTPTGGISAPMPIVSAERFLRSWSLGDP